MSLLKLHFQGKVCSILLLLFSIVNLLFGVQVAIDNIVNKLEALEADLKRHCAGATVGINADTLSLDGNAI